MIALAVLDLACVGYLLSPAGRSRQARQRDYHELRAATGRQAAGSAAHARHGSEAEAGVADIDGFYDHRFPARVFRGVGGAGQGRRATPACTLAAVKYDEKDAPIEGLRKLNIEIALSGDYLQEVKFINALERDKMFFLIDGIALGEQQGNVRLQLKLETYLRAGAATS